MYQMNRSSMFSNISNSSVIITCLKQIIAFRVGILIHLLDIKKLLDKLNYCGQLNAGGFGIRPFTKQRY